MIYFNDHRPAHVHVVGPDGFAVFDLNCPDGPVSLRESRGFRPRPLNGIATKLNAVLATCCNEWSRIHGPF
jgi:hypothetical protein